MVSKLLRPDYTYITIHERCIQHKNLTPNHKTIRTTTEVPPWNSHYLEVTAGIKSNLQALDVALVYANTNNQN